MPVLPAATEDVAAFVRHPPPTLPARLAQARELLSEPRVRPALEESLHVPELRQGVLDLARVDVQDAPDNACATRAEHWMLTAQATWQESAAFLSGVAWQARRDGRRLVDEVSRETSQAVDPIVARTRLHLLGLALRYDFRRVALEEVMLAHRGPWDVYSSALFAFALLGQSKTRGVELMHEVLTAADDDKKALHTLLHGLWLGDALPSRHQHMMSILARPPFRRRTDAVALFWEAGILREMRCFRKALDTIDRALDVLPPGDPGVHDDLVRERALIITARDMHDLVRSEPS
ncbi:hypothetical protein ACH4UR_25330 [Streptomyces lydicus]|uniref:hypothetical protein n=1 Tax=Streptomyces lydicus TaxID=47763 RepID=UPI00340A50C4